MNCDQVYYLALLQGLTEFLPISSAAHLILMPVLFGWQDQGLAFDVATHIGTLTAVVFYYRQDLQRMAVAWLRSLVSRDSNFDSRLTWYVLLGTLPVGIAGLVGKHYVETHLRTPLVIAATTIVFAILLWLSQKWGKERRAIATLDWKDAMTVGVCQAIALIPGVSRSGITITGGLFLGLDRQAAARFSFLLSIPVTALAGILKTYDLTQSVEPVHWREMLVGAVISGVVAYLTIDGFLRLLHRIGMLPFVVYRLLLGAVLLFFFLPHGLS